MNEVETDGVCGTHIAIRWENLKETDHFIRPKHR